LGIICRYPAQKLVVTGGELREGQAAARTVDGRCRT